jgi:hypothetical protein
MTRGEYERLLGITRKENDNPNPGCVSEIERASDGLDAIGSNH